MVMSLEESGYGEIDELQVQLNDGASFSTCSTSAGPRDKSRNSSQLSLDHSKLSLNDSAGSKDILYFQNFPQITDNCDVVSKIGEGTFSSVYLATCKRNKAIELALKCITPTSSHTKIENEIKCLKTIGGKDNVISLTSVLRHKGKVILIMPYFSHDKFMDYLHDMSIEEIKLYMYSLFVALNNVHKYHIIHRDIKPSNFLYNRRNRTFQLIDFGLAHLEAKTKKDHKHLVVSHGPLKNTPKRLVTKKSRCSPSVNYKNSGQGKTNKMLCPTRHHINEVCGFCLRRHAQVANRAGTPGFRAPEVLLKSPIQTTALDVWSAGVILLCLLSRRYPFFRAQDDESAMAQIISLMGTSKCSTALASFGE
jgi:cell division control protein 7